VILTKKQLSFIVKEELSKVLEQTRAERARARQAARQAELRAQRAEKAKQAAQKEKSKKKMKEPKIFVYHDSGKDKKAAVLKKSFFNELDGSGVVSYAQLQKHEIKPDSNPSNCYGAWEIKTVSAERGQSLELFINLFSLPDVKGQKIMADRFNLSPDAKKAWMKTLKGPFGTTAVSLDNYEDPQTPNIEDDCEVHGEEDLDKVITPPSMSSTMVVLNLNNQSEMQSKLTKFMGVSEDTPIPSDAKEQILTLMKKSFDDKYADMLARTGHKI
jgi:type II secretory pathway pseudopilin PulG|tara:strand:+ start:54 stop:869 length:816 start_codon:yes stop_codon:yes gene_type:complete